MFLVLQCQGLYPLPHPQYILAPTHHTLCLKNWSHRPPSPRVHTEVYNQPGGKKSITSGSQCGPTRHLSVSPIKMVFSSSIFLYSRARLQVKNQPLKGKTDTSTYCTLRVRASNPELTANTSKQRLRILPVHVILRFNSVPLLPPRRRFFPKDCHLVMLRSFGS